MIRKMAIVVLLVLALGIGSAVYGDDRYVENGYHTNERYELARINEIWFRNIVILSVDDTWIVFECNDYKEVKVSIKGSHIMFMNKALK